MQQSRPQKSGQIQEDQPIAMKANELAQVCSIERAVERIDEKIEGGACPTIWYRTSLFSPSTCIPENQFFYS